MAERTGALRPETQLLALETLMREAPKRPNGQDLAVGPNSLQSRHLRNAPLQRLMRVAR